MATTTTVRSRSANQPVFKRKTTQAPFPINLYQTAVGKKWVMALTGIMLLGFVLVHMVGNLHMYEGPERFNEYGEALRDLGGHLVPRTTVLWLMRLGLIGAFGLHIHSAVTLTRMNQQARPTKYAGDRNYVAATFASRSMRYTGVIIALYLFFHLADLTWGWFLGDNYIRGDVYNNVSRSLSNIPVAIIYVVANVAVAIHIFHGTWSLFQSLGLNNPRWNQARRGLASGLAGVILLGNLSFPILNVAGVVSQDERTYPCHVHNGTETDICLGSNGG